MDSNILWAAAGITLIMVAYEMKHHAQVKALRENYRNGSMGKFEESDFK